MLQWLRINNGGVFYRRILLENKDVMRLLVWLKWLRIVPASTWGSNHCRESNGQMKCSPNASGANGLFKQCQVEVQLQQLMIKSGCIQLTSACTNCKNLFFFLMSPSSGEANKIWWEILQMPNWPVSSLEGHWLTKATSAVDTIWIWS